MQSGKATQQMVLQAATIQFETFIQSLIRKKISFNMIIQEITQKIEEDAQALLAQTKTKQSVSDFLSQAVTTVRKAFSSMAMKNENMVRLNELLYVFEANAVSHSLNQDEATRFRVAHECFKVSITLDYATRIDLGRKAIKMVMEIGKPILQNYLCEYRSSLSIALQDYTKNSPLPAKQKARLLDEAIQLLKDNKKTQETYDSKALLSLFGMYNIGYEDEWNNQRRDNLAEFIELCKNECKLDNDSAKSHFILSHVVLGSVYFAQQNAMAEKYYDQGIELTTKYLANRPSIDDTEYYHFMLAVLFRKKYEVALILNKSIAQAQEYITQALGFINKISLQRKRNEANHTKLFEIERNKCIQFSQSMDFKFDAKSYHVIEAVNLNPQEASLIPLSRGVSDRKLEQASSEQASPKKESAQSKNKPKKQKTQNPTAPSEPSDNKAVQEMKANTEKASLLEKCAILIKKLYTAKAPEEFQNLNELSNAQLKEKFQKLQILENEKAQPKSGQPLKVKTRKHIPELLAPAPSSTPSSKSLDVKDGPTPSTEPPKHKKLTKKERAALFYKQKGEEIREAAAAVQKQNEAKAKEDAQRAIELQGRTLQTAQNNLAALFAPANSSHVTHSLFSAQPSASQPDLPASPPVNLDFLDEDVTEQPKQASRAKKPVKLHIEQFRTNKANGV